MELRPKTFDEIKEFVGSKRLSLAAKWMEREQKSIYRLDMLLAIYDQKNEIPNMLTTDLYRANKRINYYQMQFRNVISTLTQCLLVGEPMMCNGSKDHKYRSYGDIKTAYMPAKYITKYCKALGNEDLKEPITESENFTGNRYPDNEYRVACRQDLLKTIFDGKLKGASQDISSLSELIFNSFSDDEYSTYDKRTFKISPSLSVLQRKVISAQWNDITNKLKNEINVAIEAVKASAIESGESFSDPRNIVPIVDTSGSMRPVQDKAIALGILASSLSTIPGVLIAFSEVPSVYYLDMSPDKDVFDHFQTIMNGPTGLSTNIDKTYQCMLNIMKKAQIQSSECDFSMLYLTDGQFDSDLVQSESNLDKTALGRMNNIFVSSGFKVLPKIIFWNLNVSSPGFPASANTTGVQLVAGYSQSLMFQVFTGNNKYVEQEDGTFKVDVDPWTLFENALLHEGYDPVSRIVANIGEGCLSTLSNE
jgi:Mg-chelatase subunit ChlD